MENFDSFAATIDIPERNARELLARDGDTEEILLWLEEHAHEAASRFLASGIVGEISFPGCLTERESPQTQGNVTSRNVAAYTRKQALQNAYQIAYSSFFADACRKDPSFSFVSRMGEWEKTPGERFVYVHTPVSDRAYTVFSSSLRQPTVNYVGTFDDACGAIFNGQADYAILPLFGSHGESVRKVWSALERYELHIVRCVRLTVGEDGEEWMYALLSRGLFPFGTEPVDGSSVAIVFYPEEGRDVSEMLPCFTALGFRMDFMESVKDFYDRSYYRFVVSGGKYESLFAFLILQRCGFFVAGVYQTEREKKS